MTKCGTMRVYLSLFVPLRYIPIHPLALYPNSSPHSYPISHSRFTHVNVLTPVICEKDETCKDELQGVNGLRLQLFSDKTIA